MDGRRIAVIGGGPAGLMAADRLSAAGCGVDVYDRMPTMGRKFLLAGKSGLNLTHAEAHERFRRRFGEASDRLAAAVDAMPAEAVRAFADALGAETFVGSSGRVFPRVMKASPLLRAWLARLAGRGVRFHPRHRWTGWDEAGALRFETPAGPVTASPAATVLALGGASWPRLGSDGEWREALTRAGVPVSPFRPANMGFDVAWPAGFRERFAGHPVKSVTARAGDGPAVPGEFVVTAGGVEGGLVYTLSSALRDRIDAGQPAVMTLDLVPGRDRSRLARDLARVPPRASLSTRLRKGAGLTGVKAALVRLCADPADLATSDGTAAAIKALALTLAAPRPVEEAISTAGGVTLDAIDRSYMLKDRPGVFVAGEMIDWEAPTGGYLISGSLATGRAAAEGVLARLGIPSPD